MGVAASGNEEKFLECIQDSFFTQHVLLHTRGDNILDLVMSNEEGLVENLTVANHLVQVTNVL